MKNAFFGVLFSRPDRKVNTTNWIISLSLPLFMALNCSVAVADDHGIYAGIGVANITAEEQGIESSKKGFRFISGYSFNKYFAAEVALFNIGDHKKIGIKGNGYSLSVIGKKRVYDKFNVFVELGGMIVDLKVNEGSTTVDRNVDESLADGRDPGIIVGFGVTYDINAWTLALKNLSVDTDADLNITSLSAYYHF